MRLLFVFVALWFVLVGAGSISSDIAALMEFKKGISEDPKGLVLNSWDHFTSGSEGCPPSWNGIHCNGNRVTSISLRDMGLVGNISFSSLAPMDSLHNLSLSNNQFTGILTPDLGALSSLEHLDLSSNSFHGRVPEELMRLSNLITLNLSWNSFEAPLPSGFNKLQKLKCLDLQANGFNGDVGIIIGQLQSAVYVDLSQNRFTGGLGSMSDNSKITGSLVFLNTSHNFLSGELFEKDVVPLFDSLEVFDSSFNRLSGQVPSFNFIASLKILHLGSNQFSGPFPEALFKGFSMVLAELDLSCNELTGPLQSITSTTLKKLNLSSNSLSGSLPNKIGSCAILDLSNNLFSGDISAIKGWGNLVESIDLSSNKLGGTLLNETSQFLRLKSLRLSNNLLEGEFPPVIVTYPDIIFIDLSLNKLNGILPPSLFSSIRLMNLNLSFNRFTGPIFPEKLHTESLVSYDSASLPSLNSSLVSLDLSNNFLSGSLPHEMVFMTYLQLLNLSKNDFSGQIPKAMGMIQSLLDLDLSHNHFEGNLPDNLPSSLLRFDVSYNNLSGNVPNNLLRFPESSFRPGNELLNLPPQYPNIASISRKRSHHHHMKNAIIYSFIAGAVVCAVMILLFILLYQKLSKEHDRRITDELKSSIRSFFRPQKNSLHPPPSSSFSQNHLIQSRSLSSQADQGIVSVASREAVDPVMQQQYDVNDQLLQKTNTITSSSSIHQSSLQHNPTLNVLSPDRLSGELHLFDNSVVFTVEELSRAPAEIIGRSCHGTSYKATLDGGHVVAVKWLKEGIVKSKKEFSREAKKLGSIRHPNLVSLKGYYWGSKEHERLLISDCIDALPLSVHLCEFEQRKMEPLPLRNRLAISTDVARCLNYLHNEKSIPHGNLKSTNILLQRAEMSALLTDYSLHRILTASGMAEQVLNAGALGYRPPEFASTSKPCPSLKSDVYAFGVVLLELITGRNAGEIVSGNPGGVDLTDWVRSMAGNEISHECFDEKIVEEGRGDGDGGVLEVLFGVALRCIRCADERPEIRTVFQELSSMFILMSSRENITSG
ncbi:probable LRR receptor-like serine/threonine-protein kinase At4g20940 [Phalaenopsis equestris]|uniref:probable LRR receptor-like serine/threonine-protein kinase At4g20940 n=1 Tax=Phalaenopsis equestris TaxID=78828 RepID=UPI0009E5D84A|nr:probable LRR receptor-like serine/threonine-protein kinase At4g20940 [Phalaenopsis equestris]